MIWGCSTLSYLELWGGAEIIEDLDLAKAQIDEAALIGLSPLTIFGLEL